jgi:hypothetical protein
VCAILGASSCGATVVPTASEVVQTSVTTVQLDNADGTANPNAPNTSDVPYGRSVTVGIWAQVDEPAGANGFPVTLEVWEDDGADVAADQLATAVSLRVGPNLRTTRATVKLTCTDKGALQGTAGTDDDDGSEGEIRVYELYVYDTSDGIGSPLQVINCVPPATEDAQ